MLKLNFEIKRQNSEQKSQKFEIKTKYLKNVKNLMKKKLWAAKAKVIFGDKNNQNYETKRPKFCDNRVKQLKHVNIFLHRQKWVSIVTFLYSFIPLFIIFYYLTISVFFLFFSFFCFWPYSFIWGLSVSVISLQHLNIFEYVCIPVTLTGSSPSLLPLLLLAVTPQSTHCSSLRTHTLTVSHDSPLTGSPLVSPWPQLVWVSFVAHVTRSLEVTAPSSTTRHLRSRHKM